VLKRLHEGSLDSRIQKDTDPMKPKYKVGQMVRLAAGSLSRPAHSSAYEIMHVRPLSDNEYHYVVKNRDEAYQRCVREGQLSG
jgi:hypothetical protein